ncbi:signal transduction histidine kinase [Sphingobium sp. B2D3A]|uniref:sensor histidine kinase n=1 Tax=unclassified Sphingobium TaxID=2611147 RepID=UPI002225A5FE|nr:MULTISPECIES: sensor histidine kinase [unclassified Sphingobium]MCW2338255.1 signal transduction histidine kinase [Sphingobium sp. B2D3A]MCW2384713.1 signal transduction histidine kinase [Sphingobium sp. B2D3D]
MRLPEIALRILATLPAIAFLLLVAPAAYAIDPDEPLGELRHARWSISDGAPANIAAITQTHDGFLWLGTSTGLYRFDGIAFEHIEAGDQDPARSLQVTALLAARNGDLWVGYDYGGVAVYRHGKLLSANDGIPRGSISRFAEGSDGAIWAISTSTTPKRLRFYKDGRWHWLKLGDEIPDEHLQDLLPAPDGRVLLVTHHAVGYLNSSDNHFDRLPITTNFPAAVAHNHSGHTWLIDGEVRRLDGKGTGIKLNTPGFAYILRRTIIDRNGSLWVTGQGDGLVRVSARALEALAKGRQDGKGTVETFSDTVGSITLSVYEDREGNVWVGSEGGLDRFSPIDIHLVRSVPTVVTGLIRPPGSDSIFFGGPGKLYRLTGAPARIAVEASVAGNVVNICGAASGEVLLLTTRDAFLWSGGRLTRQHVNVPSAGAVTACAADGTGGWIVATTELYSLRGSKLTLIGGPISAMNRAMLLRSLKDGGVLAYRALDGLRVARDGKVETIWQGRNIPVGFIKTVVPFEDGFLIGGEHGLARYDGKTFWTIDDRRHPFFANVTGVMPLQDGNTWIITAYGVAKIRSSDLELTFRNPERQLRAFVFGRDKGISARSNGYDMADITVSKDGRLWLATNEGLAWIDPKKLSPNSLPPPVVIRSLLADDHPISLSASAPRLPAGTLRVALDFTALSFTDPAANKFRFRLVGFDKDWVDAGTRRQAYYSNLAPGTYRFQVIASNGDGVWNNKGSSIEFSIAPRFYQTWWFRSVMAILLFACAIGLFRWRARSVAQRIRNRVEARVEERERIARELHDTLLQGVQGLLMRFQAVAEVIPADSRARGMIEKTLERGDDVVVQSRERVRSLRSSAPGDIERRIEDLGYEAVEIRVAGVRRPVCGPVIDEIGAIVSEALSNAERHSRAKHVSVEIRYGYFALDIQVKDDGDGIDRAILANGGRSGHFGLQGMRERADKLGGKLVIQSNRASGTLVQVRVPARIAYRSMFFWPWRRHDEANL